MSAIPAISDRDGTIWMDGQLIDWRDAKVHVLTHTLHYGCGAFEGVRAYQTDKGTAIFRLQEHTQRLLNSAKIFQMAIPYDLNTLMEAQKEVVRVNQLESCYIRPIAWIGSQKLGIGAMTAAHIKSFYDKMVKAKVLQEGIDIKKSYTLDFVNEGVGLDLKK